MLCTVLLLGKPNQFAGGHTMCTTCVPSDGVAVVGSQHCRNTVVSHDVARAWDVVQDPVPKMAKFWFLYARPGQRVLLYKNGDMVVSPTPLDIRLQGYSRSKQTHNSALRLRISNVAANSDCAVGPPDCTFRLQGALGGHDGRHLLSCMCGCIPAIFRSKALQ